MTFAGIDFDTRAVHVVLTGEAFGAAYRCYPLEGLDALERTRAVRDALPARGWWRDEGIVALGIEEPQGIQKSTVAKLKAIQGAILSCLPRDLLVNPMVPASWRTACGLKGNATKGEVREWAFTHGFVFRPEIEGELSQDAADAYCLAVAVERLTVNATAA